MALGLATALVRPANGWAGAFFLQEQSAKGVGRAFAGQSALATDGSSLFFNPATITQLRGMELGLGSYWIHGQLDVSDRGSTVTSPGTLGTPAPAGGGSGDDAIGGIPLASLYAVLPMQDERYWLGFSANAPFGLRTDYGEGWFGRYDSTLSELVTLELAPVVGFSPVQGLSLGASLSVQYAQAKLDSVLPNPFGPPSPATDARLRIEGDDWSVGVNAGLLYEPRPDLRLGLAYRTGIEHDLRGSARFAGLSGPLAAQNGRTPGSAALELPDVALFGVAFEATPRLTLLGQMNWYNWSEFKEIRAELDTGQDLVSAQDYEDTLSGALGLEFRWSQRLTLRAGVQFDPTPVRDAARSTRVPDADRTWLSFGVSYELRPGVDLDFGYTHIWVRNADLDRTDVLFAGTPAASSARVRGEAEAAIDIVAVQLSYRF